MVESPLQRTCAPLVLGLGVIRVYQDKVLSSDSLPLPSPAPGEGTSSWIS